MQGLTRDLRGHLAQLSGHLAQLSVFAERETKVQLSFKAVYGWSWVERKADPRPDQFYLHQLSSTVKKN